MPATILSLVWYKILPPKFGGQKGIALFNQHLSRHCDLHCLCSKDNEDNGALSYRLSPVLPAGRRHVFNPFYWSTVNRVAKQDKPFLLILEHPYHGLTAIIAARHAQAGFIVHAHNIESSRFRQIGKWWWPLLKVYEGVIYRRASSVIFKTEQDKALAMQQFRLPAKKCMVIPYGIEVPVTVPDASAIIRQQYNIAPDEKILLFAGTLDYEPNAKAVEDIFNELLPRLKAAGYRFRIIICGRNKFRAFQYLHQYSDPLVIMAGEQESIAPFFSAANAFINPVLSGGGIQTKTLDAIAHHCNTVCFASQSTGIPRAVCGSKLLVADDADWPLFTALTIKAMQEYQDTPRVFFDHFNWELLLQPLIRKLPFHD